MKKGITTAELKLLLAAHFEAELRRQAKLADRLNQELGKEVQPEAMELIVIRKSFVDLSSDLLARRLMQKRRTTPLISSRDIIRFSIPIINEMIKDIGGELNIEERKMVSSFIKTAFDSLSNMIHPLALTRGNPYDERWRLVKTVLKLAEERGVLPTELFTSEETADEITRRMFTKKQFLSRFKKAMSVFTDADVMREKILQPMLEMMVGDNEEDRRELEQELGAKIMPQLREIIEKWKVVINTWLGEEVKRIYIRA
ncbi:MAG: hypothetical protein AAB575_05330 [Patescibacteria group bacterium]